MQSIIWQRLKRAPMNAHQERRVETVALAWLSGRARREFWDMGRYARFRGSARFWAEVDALAQSAGHTSGGVKARWLLLARANYPVRQWVGRELRQMRNTAGHAPDFRFLSAELK
jgi:hypothetical protein